MAFQYTQIKFQKSQLKKLRHPLSVIFSNMLLFSSRDGVVMLHHRHRASQDVDVSLVAGYFPSKFEEGFNLFD